jgi:hypothetical protein
MSAFFDEVDRVRCLYPRLALTRTIDLIRCELGPADLDDLARCLRLDPLQTAVFCAVLWLEAEGIMPRTEGDLQAWDWCRRVLGVPIDEAIGTGPARSPCEYWRREAVTR